MRTRLPLFALCAFSLFAFLCLTRTGAQTGSQLASNPRKAIGSYDASAASNASSRARTAPPRRLIPLRVEETAGGSRVRVASDAALDDYVAYREGERFYVLLPRAEASFDASDIEGRGFRGVSVERRGADVLLAFTLEAGTTARVSQKFNRLDVLFNVSSQTPATPSGQSAQSSAATQTTTSGQSTQTPTSTPPQGGTSVQTTTGAGAQTTQGGSVAQPANNTPSLPETSATPNAEVANPDAPAANAPITTASKGTSNTAKAMPANRAVAGGMALPPEKVNAIRVARFDKPPVIDGKLDDEIWQHASVFKDFYQIRPGDNIAPSQPTEALMAFDAKFLYVAFRAHDEPGKVRATIAKRDSIFDDDFVGVFLDTYNDKRKAYELLFNPLGVQADGTLTEGNGEDFNVDIVMESKGVVTSEGYTVEVAIPFKSLRYEAGKDKLWGVHFIRTIKRNNNEQDSWMPISRDNSSTLNQSGHITGLEGLSTERTLELIPSLTLSETGKRVPTLTIGQVNSLNARGAEPHDPGRFVNKPFAFEPGLTAKLGITPTITLDLALNPDFAQVEADQTVVTANQRFPIFFPEKRPFFLEGIDIFNTIISAVNTRAIADPDVAVKLTGKRGRDSFGIMLASDNAPGNFSEEERSSLNDPDLDPDQRNFITRFLDKNSYIGVFRVKRDVGKENNIGFLGTTYNFADKHNHMGGLDARFRLNKTTTLTAQALGSMSRMFFFYPNEDGNFKRTENGMAYAFDLNMDGRNWGYELAGVGRSRFFRAEVGFNRRYNTNNPSLFVRYKSTEKPKAKLVYWRLFNAISSNFDWHGRSQRVDNNTQLQLNFPKQSFFAIGAEEGFERIFEEEFGATRSPQRPCLAFGADPERPNLPQCTFYGQDDERSATRRSLYFYGGTTPSKKYSVFFLNQYNWGVMDFDFGAGPRYPRISPAALRLGQDAPLDPGSANEWYIESNFAYQPLDALRLSLDYVKDRLTRRDTGRVAFDDNIFTLRGTYQFNRFVFARARVDYTTLGANARAQFLFGYTPNPGTALYLGYNDDMNRNGFNPFSGELEPGFRRNGRTFFIKASYLIRRSF